LFSSYPDCTIRKEIANCDLHLAGRLRSASLMKEYLTNVFETLLHRTQDPPFIYLFIHLFILVWAHRLLYYASGIIKYYLILLLKWFQISPLGALSPDFSIQWTKPFKDDRLLFTLVFEHFIVSWHYRCSRYNEYSLS
jgi:hypothetical protein